MQYDPQWTSQERARVEAARMLINNPHTNYATTAELMAAVAELAKFIAGPEAEHPFPWDAYKTAYEALRTLFEESLSAHIGGVPVSAWTQVPAGPLPVDGQRLKAILNSMPAHEPPF